LRYAFAAIDDIEFDYAAAPLMAAADIAPRCAFEAIISHYTSAIAPFSVYAATLY